MKTLISDEQADKIKDFIFFEILQGYRGWEKETAEESAKQSANEITEFIKSIL